MLKALRLLFSFFGKVDGTRKGLLVPEELFRSIVAAFGSGASISLVVTILQAVVSHAALIFPNPAVAGLASTILTLVLDLLRRQNQGTPRAGDAPDAPTP